MAVSYAFYANMTDNIDVLLLGTKLVHPCNLAPIMGLKGPTGALRTTMLVGTWNQ